ncbi:class I SAM-dependent methyltransferase [Lentzea sp. NPDC058436]|uniref:class I SAM-dependent methyltransferase n=1 Tax=Lentzea sp. NPDC058436 TaxID=3346499 RepID=UPI003647D54A
MNKDFYDNAYAQGVTPWVIGGPQLAVVQAEREGWFTGPVLDLGCGAGENTIFLTRAGYETFGVDISEAAIDLARAKAVAEEVQPWFVVGDALRPAELELPARRWATVLDCALFHIFDAADRAAYVRSLAGLLEPGGHVVVLAMSTDGPHFGPEVDDEVIRAAFAEPDWEVEVLRPSSFRGRISHERETGITGLSIGDPLDVPARLARVRFRVR